MRKTLSLALVLIFLSAVLVVAFTAAGLFAATEASAQDGGKLDQVASDRSHNLSQGTFAPQYDTYKVKLLANKDAFAASSNPDGNYGGLSKLHVGDRAGFGATRTVVGFSFDDLEKEEVVLEGVLNLYVSEVGPPGDAGRDIVVRRTKSGWNEGDLTWNRFPSVSDERLDTVNMGASTGWRSWKVNKAVRNWYYEEWDNNGLYVQGYEAEGSYRSFDSREGSNDPELELTVAIDDLPPVATLNPLPQYYNKSDITLTWEEGIDPEPASGIDYYEVWYRRDQGQWLLAHDHVVGLSHVFSGAASGYVYSFKILAVDRAGLRQVDGPAQTQTLVDLEMPVAAVTPLPQWVNGPFNVTWGGEDLPRPPLQASGIKHFDTQLSIANGAWGTLILGTTSTSHRYEPQHAQTYNFRVRAVDLATNPGEFDSGQVGTRGDMEPPATWFYPASGVDSPRFLLRWGGSDHELSGISVYDIDYQEGSGAWQQLIYDTAATSINFDGTYGNTYGFRSRARDNAGNLGAWPSTPQRYVAVIESAKLTYSVIFPVVYNER